MSRYKASKQMRDLMGQKVRGKNGELEGSNECMSEKEMEI